MAVKPIPDGYHTVTPHLTVQGAPALIEFLKQAFDAQVIHCMTSPDGGIRHAEVRIGDSPMMIGEATEEWKAMPTTLYLYVREVDATYERAISAGGVSISPPQNQFYGDRCGAVKDPSGNYWCIATHVEDVAPEELEKRAAAARK
ncbi:MAG: VOC family protein [Blastocatellia bacterium]